MNSEHSAEYNCKILPLGTFLTIVLATNISVGILYVLLLIGIPILIGAILFTGVMFATLFLISNDALFIISDSFLIRTLDKKKRVFKNFSDKKYSWSDVKNFKNGTDRGRYRGEYQFLEIVFKDNTTWTITDMYGERKEKYLYFLNFFLSKVNQYNEEKRIQTKTTDSPIMPKEVLKSTSTVIDNTIERKKTFYETFSAKIFTFIMTFFTLGLLYFFILHPAYLHWTSLFNLTIVIIPGLLYVIYRVFFKKKD